ncbi:hypothetical protein NKI88_09060 [Mesorhizobium sp. M0317]|uniref:hypothetical protein n=1 Tax=Mesorhizobium sp. M0317 TaxID=2956935 RepID=UPI003339360B
MANDQSKTLAVDVIARVDKLEKAMEKAKKVVNDRFNDIENRGKKLTERLNASFAGIGSGIKGNYLDFFKGIGAGAIAALGPIALVEQALKAIDNASHLVDTADRVGLTTTALQQLTFGFSQAGVEASEFESAMDKFSKNIGEAATSGGHLAEILKANGIAIRDQNGHIKTSEQLLADYADLIKNAASEQEKMLLVTEAFGKGGAAMLVGLNDGAQGIVNMKKAADEAGGAIDEQLLRRAEEMGDRWDAAWHRFAVSSQSAILTAIEGMDGLNKIFLEHEQRKNAALGGALVGSLVGKPGDVLTGLGKGDKPGAVDVRIAQAFGGEVTKADDALVAQLKARYGDASRKATIIPPSGGGGAKSSGSKFTPKTANDRFAEDLQTVRDHTAALNEEIATLGLSFEAQTKRRVALDLEQTALKQVREEARKKGDADWQNVQLSPAQVAAINSVSDAYAKQAEELRKAQGMQALQRDVLKGVFDDLRGALDDGKLDWQDFANIAESALDKIIDKIENDLIDAIMQASNAGGGGGILGSILGMFTGGGGSSFNPTPGGFAQMLGIPGYANGTNNHPGGLAIVGEKGPELLNLPRGSQVIPRVPSIQAVGGGRDQAVSVSFNPTINMPNAQKGAGDEVTAALKAYQKDFTMNVVKALREAKQRGMT